MSALKYLARRLAGLILGLALALPAARAHEIRPAYLDLKETAPGQYDVLWRTPVLSGMRLPLALQMPADVRNLRVPQLDELTDSLVERRWVDAGPGGIEGKRIDFPGLQLTITDVLVRIERLNGTHSTDLIHPSRPYLEVPPPRGALATAAVFLTQGIEHIFFGPDHLLFVLALILIVRDGRVLLWTISAFTLAHSITLSLATLGVVHVPGPPVEAMIALSILLLACEIVLRRGETSLTARRPWLVAFSFGLLHGFGFASALTKIGLPQGDIPLALFSFNVGVEVGQLVFIGVVLGALFCIRPFRVRPTIRQAAVPVTSYAIGSVAAFWFIERLAGFAG